MPPVTLPAFSPDERTKAHALLATRVAEMMGRKFEEGDWSAVYTAAKEYPEAPWSNLSIDITHGVLGVEHKMMCRPATKPIMDACGTSIMHPAGTRAIRIPREEDPTKAARDVLRQYGDIIDERTAIVRILNHYHHQIISRDKAIVALAAEARMTRASAGSILPQKLRPIGSASDVPDMRMGWILWESGLREFLYFEEPMSKPNPLDFTAEWRDSGGGRRKASRNLWVYHTASGEKQYSITTDAGAKIQPYFTVPLPTDPNLYHFVVQGEEIETGLVRVWLTPGTAELLEQTLGDVTPETIASVVNSHDLPREKDVQEHAGTGLAVPILVPLQTYKNLLESLEGVSDEHTFKLLIDLLRRAREKN